MNLQDLANQIRQLRDQLDTYRSKNIDMKGRRVVGAHPSIDPYDYVVRKELDARTKSSTTNNTITNAEKQKATFGLYDVSQGPDKTPHYIVMAGGKPYDLHANPKIAPAGSDVVINIRYSTDDGVLWSNILLPSKLVLPVGSTNTVKINSFENIELAHENLICVDVVQGDSAGICAEVEIVLRWE